MNPKPLPICSLGFVEKVLQGIKVRDNYYPLRSKPKSKYVSKFLAKPLEAFEHIATQDVSIAYNWQWPSWTRRKMIGVLKSLEIP